MTKNIKIPNNCQLFKMASCNINMNDNINRRDDIEKISKYIFSKFSGVENDVVCLQNINDEKILALLNSEINKISESCDIPVQIVPNINTGEIGMSFENSLKKSWNASYEYNDTNNVIISKYPILVTSEYTLNNITDEKLIGRKKSIVANINVNGYIISVFNIVLSSDFIGVSNSEYRKNEIENLTKFIEENTVEIKKYNQQYWNNKLIIKDVNIVTGCFNMSEIKNSGINIELQQCLKSAKLLDILRYHSIGNNAESLGNTKSDETRDCYMTLHYPEYQQLTIFDTKEISKNILKSMGFGVILSSTIKNIIINENYPIETIFLLQTNEKMRLV